MASGGEEQPDDKREDRHDENFGLLGGLDAIDAQIHSKIGVLESLLGSCDGVLNIHSASAVARERRQHPEAVEDTSPAHRSHHGNPVQGITTPHAADTSPADAYVPSTGLSQHEPSHGAAGARMPDPRVRHRHEDSASNSFERSSVALLVNRMVEAARLLRTQRLLCRVTQQICSAKHGHFCRSSLRMHQLAEKQIRHDVASEFGRAEVVRGMRLISWAEELALTKAFLGWYMVILRSRDTQQEKDRVLLISTVKGHCLQSQALRGWLQVVKDSCICNRKFLRRTAISILSVCFLGWKSAHKRRESMRYKNLRLAGAKRRCIIQMWKRLVRERAIEFGLGACNGALSVLCSLRVRSLAVASFRCWLFWRMSTNSRNKCKSRQTRAASCLGRVHIRKILHGVVISWRCGQLSKHRLKLRSAKLRIRCRGRLSRVAFHCWYAVWHESKAAAQRWWWENKTETLMREIEVHEQACAQQDRTMQVYLNDSCLLEDTIRELRTQIDWHRSNCAHTQLKYSGFIRMLSIAFRRTYASFREQYFQQNMLEASDAFSVAASCSGEAAILTTVFSAWSCALATLQFRKLQSSNLKKKLEKAQNSQIIVVWRILARRSRQCSKCGAIIARRHNTSILRCFMRRWSGTYFPYVTYHNIRKCRTRHMVQRRVFSILGSRWSNWRHACVLARRFALALERGNQRIRRKLLFNCLASWYVFSIVEQKQVYVEWLGLDKSYVDAEARGSDVNQEGNGCIGEGARAGVLEQSAMLVHLLVAKEFELQGFRQQIGTNNASSENIKTTFSQSEIAGHQDKLSSEDESWRLDRGTVLQADASRDRHTCGNKLDETDEVSGSSGFVAEHFMDVSSGLLTSDELCRRSEMASLNDETKPAQDSFEPSTPREKLKEQGITEHEHVLHAALAQSSILLDGEAVIELMDSASQLRNDFGKNGSESDRQRMTSPHNGKCSLNLSCTARYVVGTSTDKEEREFTDQESMSTDTTKPTETHVLFAEEMSCAHMLALEQIQALLHESQSKAKACVTAKEAAEAKILAEIRETLMWQTQAKEYLTQKEAAEMKTLEEMRKITEAEKMASKAVLDIQKTCDEVMRREETVKAELLLVQEALDVARSSLEMKGEELRDALDAIRLKDEAIRQMEIKSEIQQHASTCMEKEFQQLRENSQREVAAQQARFAAVSEALERLRTQNSQMYDELDAVRLSAACSSTELVIKEEEIRRFQNYRESYTVMSDAVEKLQKQNAQLDEELAVLRRASEEGKLLLSAQVDWREMRMQMEKDLVAKNEEIFKLQHKTANLESEQRELKARLLLSETVCQEQEGRFRVLNADLEITKANHLSLGDDTHHLTSSMRHDISSEASKGNYLEKMHAGTIQNTAFKARIFPSEHIPLMASNVLADAVSGTERDTRSEFKRSCVEMIVQLGLNMSVAGDEGSKARRIFEKSLLQDLANASNLPATRFVIERLSAGSIIVDVKVVSPKIEDSDAFQVVQNLQAQANDEKSQLMNGILTRYVTSIKLSKSQRSGPSAVSTRESFDQARSEQVSLQTHRVMTSVKLKDLAIMEDELKRKDTRIYFLEHQNSIHEADKLSLKQEIQDLEQSLAVQTSALTSVEQRAIVLGVEKKAIEDKLAMLERKDEEQAERIVVLHGKMDSVRESALQLSEGYYDELADCDTPDTGSDVKIENGPVLQFSKRMDWGVEISVPTMPSLAKAVLNEHHGKVVGLQVALKDVTSQLNEIKKQLDAAVIETIECERSAQVKLATLDRSHQEIRMQLQAVKTERDCIQTRMQVHFEHQGQMDAWSDEVSTLRVQLEAAEAKANADSSRAASADAINRMNYETWRSHWEDMKAQKQDAESKADAAQKGVEALNGQLLKAERELSMSRQQLAVTQAQLKQSFDEKSALELRAMKVEGIATRNAARSIRELQNDLQTVKSQRDAFQSTSEIWQNRAQTEIAKCQALEVSMDGLKESMQSLEHSCKAFDLTAKDLQMQRDVALARSTSSETRTKNLQKALTVTTVFLQNLYQRMEETRSSRRQPCDGEQFPDLTHLTDLQDPTTRLVSSLGLSQSNQAAAKEWARGPSVCAQNLESDWSEGVSDPGDPKVKADDEGYCADLSSDQVCKAHLDFLKVWACKMHALVDVSTLQTPGIKQDIQESQVMQSTNRDCKQTVQGLERGNVPIAQLHNGMWHSFLCQRAILERTEFDLAIILKELSHLQTICLDAMREVKEEQHSSTWISALRSPSPYTCQDLYMQCDTGSIADARVVDRLDQDISLDASGGVFLSKAQVEETQILESALDAALDQVATYKEEKEGALRMVEEYQRQNSTMQERVLKYQEERDMALDNARLANGKCKDLEQINSAWQHQALALTSATEELSPFLTEQLKVLEDLLSTVNYLLSQKESCLAQVRQNVDKVNGLEQTKLDLCAKLHQLSQDQKCLQDLAIEWKNQEELLYAQLSEERNKLVKQNKELQRREESQTAAIQALTAVCNSVEESCQRLQQRDKEITSQNEFLQLRLQQMALERDEALIDRDEALNRSWIVLNESQEQHKEQLGSTLLKDKRISDQEDQIRAMSHMLQTIEQTCLSWEDVANKLEARTNYLQSAVYEACWARSCAEVGMNEAIGERKQYAAALEQIGTRVEGLETLSRSLEGIMQETALQKEIYSQQVLDAYAAEFSSNQKWSAKLRESEHGTLAWKTAAETALSQQRACELELKFASNNIEAIETVLRIAHIKCQELVVHVDRVLEERSSIALRNRPKFEGDESLAAERNAALERAVAAESQVQLWQGKIEGIQAMWIKWREHTEASQQQLDQKVQKHCVETRQLEEEEKCAFETKSRSMPKPIAAVQDDSSDLLVSPELISSEHRNKIQISLECSDEAAGNVDVEVHSHEEDWTVQHSPLQLLPKTDHGAKEAGNRMLDAVMKSPEAFEAIPEGLHTVVSQPEDANAINGARIESMQQEHTRVVTFLLKQVESLKIRLDSADSEAVFETLQKVERIVKDLQHEEDFADMEERTEGMQEQIAAMSSALVMAQEQCRAYTDEVQSLQQSCNEWKRLSLVARKEADQALRDAAASHVSTRVNASVQVETNTFASSFDEEVLVESFCSCTLDLESVMHQLRAQIRVNEEDRLMSKSKVIEAQQALLVTQKVVQELKSQLHDCISDQCFWKIKSDEAEQLLSKLRENKEQQEVWLIESKDKSNGACRSLWEDRLMWKSRAETAVREKEEIAVLLSTLLSELQVHKDATPTAVALTLDCKHEKKLDDAQGAASFKERLQGDIQRILGVAKSSVTVFCYQQDSIVAEVLLRSSDDGHGNMLTSPELAARLEALVARRDGQLQSTDVGRFITHAEIHGHVTESVVTAVELVLQEQMKQQTPAMIIANQRDKLLTQLDELSVKMSRVEEERDALLMERAKKEETEIEHKLTGTQGGFDASSSTLAAAAHLEMEAMVLEKNELTRLLCMADAKCKEYSASLKQCQEEMAMLKKQMNEYDFYSSEKVKNARSQVILLRVLKYRRFQKLQLLSIRVLNAWVGRQKGIREIMGVVLRCSHEYVMQGLITHWRNLKRRQQHRRRIAFKKLEDASAPIRALRMLGDSFRWWKIASLDDIRYSNTPTRVGEAIRVIEKQPQHEIVSPPLWSAMGRMTKPITSPRIHTPRESLGAIASAGATTISHRNFDDDRHPFRPLSGVLESQVSRNDD